MIFDLRNYFDFAFRFDVDGRADPELTDELISYLLIDPSPDFLDRFFTRCDVSLRIGGFAIIAVDGVFTGDFNTRNITTSRVSHEGFDMVIAEVSPIEAMYIRYVLRKFGRVRHNEPLPLDKEDNLMYPRTATMEVDGMSIANLLDQEDKHYEKFLPFADRIEGEYWRECVPMDEPSYEIHIPGIGASLGAMKPPQSKHHIEALVSSHMFDPFFRETVLRRYAGDWVANRSSIRPVITTFNIHHSEF